MSKIIIAGCGYVGKKITKSFNDQSDRVVCLVCSDKSYKELHGLYDTYQFNLDEVKNLPDINYLNSDIVYLVPPSSHGIDDSRIKYFLSNLDVLELPKKIVLISTTGVYGDCNGDWITEERQAIPGSERGLRRLSAENVLQEFCIKNKIAYVILRVPGIYGADKLPLQRLLDRKPVLKLSEAPWSNRIHVDDLVEACLCSINYSGDCHIFNISDDLPSSMTDYFFQVARNKGIELPPQLSMNECEQIFSTNMMSYLRESKKIDNTLMKKELGVVLQYPTLKEGLLSGC